MSRRKLDRIRKHIAQWMALSGMAYQRRADRLYRPGDKWFWVRNDRGMFMWFSVPASDSESALKRAKRIAARADLVVGPHRRKYEPEVKRK